jgi:hypothetical protein
MGKDKLFSLKHLMASVTKTKLKSPMLRKFNKLAIIK